MTISMDDEPEASLEVMRERAQFLKSEYVLRFSFAVIDAALHDHLYNQKRLASSAPGFWRIDMTHGSTHYVLHFPGRTTDFVEVATIEIRAVGSERTYITCIPEPFPDDVPQEEHDYLEHWCKFTLMLFLLGFWLDQEHMAALDALSPTPGNTAELTDEKTQEETYIFYPAYTLEHESFDSQTPETTSVPPIPDPTKGLTQVLNWFDRYGSGEGLNIDQMARKIGFAPKTLYNARHATGRTRKKGIGKNKGKKKEIKGNSAS